MKIQYRHDEGLKMFEFLHAYFEYCALHTSFDTIVDHFAKVVLQRVFLAQEIPS